MINTDLLAMSIGHTSPIDSFETALNKVIIDHPESEVSQEATRILTLIKILTCLSFFTRGISFIL